MAATSSIGTDTHQTHTVSYLFVFDQGLEFFAIRTVTDNQEPESQVRCFFAEFRHRSNGQIQTLVRIFQVFPDNRSQNRKFPTSIEADKRRWKGRGS